MKFLIYCRRETGLADLERECCLLCQYAQEMQYQISSVVLELDDGAFAERLGVYEVLRQLQAGCAEGLLLSDLSALGRSQQVQRQVCQCFRGYPLLVVSVDSFAKV